MGNAAMAELVDARDLKSRSPTGVRVRFPLAAVNIADSLNIVVVWICFFIPAHIFVYNMPWRCDLRYGIVNRPEVFLYEDDLRSRGDELLYGWAVEIRGEREEFYDVETHYGYTGWLPKAAVLPVSLTDLQAREKRRRTKVVIRRFMDVLDEPRVQGKILCTLGRGCMIEVTGEAADGYVSVKTLDGQTGFLSETALIDRADTDAYFWADDREHFFLHQLDQAKTQDAEELLRARAVSMAKLYDGGQYRWAGKSAHGTDCSGLTFMSWFLTGILIYRDASIENRWPVREITLDQILPGDLIYFPGHIGMYIGNDHFIHSTGYSRDFGVAVNSLNPKDDDYRDDLAHAILHVGSLFGAD